ncbi:YceI family protein [Pelagicoccus sp. SDUM812003]|uniref:YceI family protein n=1 Tax=Pelagicoccus sp. SDUM812003 TaxID=3041267 RepID=UPI00280FE7AD|nr:YceI family protein [Pelagicoccus sp. SDUM812003]MDQ8202248.1 YceI family protein [Pelagicoccus sp. SDUM812003]
MIKPLVSFAVFSLLAVWASAGSVAVDPERSSVEVQVKATGHSFPVVLTGYQADIELSPEAEVSSAKFSFSPTNLVSDNRKRDKKMLGWLEVEAYPRIEFAMTGVEQDGNEGRLLGELTMHGVTRPVEVPFKIERQGEQVTISGTSTVNHEPFDLEVITMLFFKVNPELNLTFTLVGSIVE